MCEHIHIRILFTAVMPIKMDLYDQAIQAIRRKIGVKWPELARALQFDDTDIDAIKVGLDRDDLNGQIYKMIRQWEQRHDSGKRTVHELLCGLRSAVNSTGDARLKEIRDRIFTDILISKWIGMYFRLNKQKVHLSIKVAMLVSTICVCVTVTNTITFIQEFVPAKCISCINVLHTYMNTYILYKNQYSISTVVLMYMSSYKCYNSNYDDWV